MTVTIEAMYIDGVLIPQGTLDLPENMTYQVQIVSVVKEKPAAKTLFGAFPELTAIADGVDDVKQLWRDSVDKQITAIQSKES